MSYITIDTANNLVTFDIIGSADDFTFLDVVKTIKFAGFGLAVAVPAARILVASGSITIAK
tara:strand:+ start:1007 stop:1189 length:183 start_codon:yes stop_codon:yes gene_type:complete